MGRELCFMPATFEDYLRWARVYTRQKGKFNRYIHGPWDNKGGRFVVAIQDFTLKGGYGLHSLSIIIPETVKYLGGEVGHCNLYSMRGTVIPDAHFATEIPLYNEPELLELPGAAKYARTERKEMERIRKEWEREEEEDRRRQREWEENSDIGYYLATLRRVEGKK